MLYSSSSTMQMFLASLLRNFLFNWNLRRYTAFAETDAAQRILEKSKNTLRSQRLDITSIQFDVSVAEENAGLLLNE